MLFLSQIFLVFFFNAYLFKTIVMLQSSSKSILHSQTQCKFKTCRKNLQLCAYIKSSLHVVIQRNLLIEKKNLSFPHIKTQLTLNFRKTFLVGHYHALF